MTLAVRDVEYLRALIARHSGNCLDATHDYLYESRLHRLTRGRGFSSVAQLVAALRSAPGSLLEHSVAEAMTINETSFFREPAAFELLRRTLLPALIARRRQRRNLLFWSAACSSGQEVYSLAMLLRENVPLLTSWTIDILGTDLCAELIARAAAARYSRVEVSRGLPTPLLLRYMVRAGDDAWEVSPALRSLCRFQPRNLCTTPPLPQLCDVIFLRNVMLYFPPATRARVLQTIHRSLAPDGILFLGATEQMPDSPLWKAVRTPGAVWYCPLPAR